MKTPKRIHLRHMPLRVHAWNVPGRAVRVIVLKPGEKSSDFHAV